MSAAAETPWEESPAAAPEVSPLGGVSFDTWVAVEAGLVRDRVAPADYDTYAQRHGVPAGGWAAASAAWHQRTTSDWRVGARFGEAYEAALKGRR